MGVGYILVNQTKCEQITFAHLPANTAREIAGQPVAAAVVAWYLLHNQGDQIAFVSDTHGEWPFPGKKPDTKLWPDRTDDVVASLIKNGILRDDGMEYKDEDAPNTIFIRKLTNIWISVDTTEPGA
jgi:hypothetical protein